MVSYTRLQFNLTEHRIKYILLMPKNLIVSETKNVIKSFKLLCYLAMLTSKALEQIFNINVLNFVIVLLIISVGFKIGSLYPSIC